MKTPNARVAMLGAIAVLLAAFPALAGPRDAEIEALVDTAVADWTAPLICSSFEQETHKTVLDSWTKERAQMTLELIRLKVASDVLKRIAAKTAPAAIMAMLDKPAREVSAYCLAEKDWLTRVYTFNVIYIGQRLAQMPLE